MDQEKKQELPRYWTKSASQSERTITPAVQVKSHEKGQGSAHAEHVLKQLARTPATGLLLCV